MTTRKKILYADKSFAIPGVTQSTEWWAVDANEVKGIVNAKADAVETILLGEAVNANDLLYLNTDGKYYKADNTSSTTSVSLLRIAIVGGLIDTNIEVLIHGQITLSGLTNGIYYVGITGVTGGITNIKPIGINIVRIIGYAIDSINFYFDPASTYIIADGSEVNGIALAAGGLWQQLSGFIAPATPANNVLVGSTTIIDGSAFQVRGTSRFAASTSGAGLIFQNAVSTGQGFLLQASGGTNQTMLVTNFNNTLDIMVLLGNGEMKLGGYGGGTIIGTPTFALAVDTNGNVIEIAIATGNVTKVGTPVNNQVGIWTGDGTIEGDANLTFDGDRLTVDNFGAGAAIGIFSRMNNGDANSTAILANNISPTASLHYGGHIEGTGGVNGIGLRAIGNLADIRADGTGIVQTKETSSSATPPTGFGNYYFKISDSKPYAKNDAGTEFDLSGAAKTVIQETASFTLTLAMVNNIIIQTANPATTVTIPTNATLAIVVGSEFTIGAIGNGTVTFVTTGVTLLSNVGTTILTNGIKVLRKIATDVWILGGQ